MEKNLFGKLLSSAKQAKDISKGKVRPSRRFIFKPEDIAKIRKQLSLSQSKFAELLKVPPSTLQNWEQGRTTPDAPAQTLLLIAHKHPNVLREIADETNVVYKSTGSSYRLSKRAASVKRSKLGSGKSRKVAKKRSVK